MAAYNLSNVIQLLNPDNTISAHRMLAHAIGMTETIIYSALISKHTYYSQNGILLDGSFLAIKNVTALTRESRGSLFQ